MPRCAARFPPATPSSITCTATTRTRSSPPPTSPTRSTARPLPRSWVGMRCWVSSSIRRSRRRRAWRCSRDSPAGRHDGAARRVRGHLRAAACGPDPRGAGAAPFPGTGLARRLIPCLDVAGGRVVKGVRFQELRDAGDPAEQAARYDAEGADELVFLDIAASHEERGTTLDMVSRVAETLFIPFTVGGGIRSVADARAVLRAGADKVAVNTAAVRDPSLVTRLADEFGRQCVVAAVGAKGREGGRANPKGLPGGRGEGWEVMVRGGRESTELEAVDWAVRLESLGAGEILLTSVDADGTQNGYDLSLTGPWRGRCGSP